MDLSTNYLGLRLKNPLMPGASPLVDDLDAVRKLEDAGASAIVLHSLFEEQISGEQLSTIYSMEMFADSVSEALSWFPHNENYVLGPDAYLEHIRKIKAAVSVPVIASLNGTTPGGWTEYARLIEQAGADALELNVYHLATDPKEPAEQVEQRVLDCASTVRAAVRIPISIKLSPFFSSLPNLAARLDDLGADGMVLFNRFYQPDIDLETLQASPKLQLSHPSELLLRLRWIAILSPHFSGTIACSGGVHAATDAVKAIMAGSHAVQIVSALLRNGPEFLGVLLNDLKAWMETNEFSSVRSMTGSMSLARCPDPAAFERANYMRVLQSWRAGLVQ